jgi:hypothetical protein
MRALGPGVVGRVLVVFIVAVLLGMVAVSLLL